MTPPQCKQVNQLYLWAKKLRQRLPSHFDSRLTQGIYTFLSPAIPPKFVATRAAHHLKKLLLTQFFLQKTIESHRDLVVKIFDIDGKICIALAYPKKDRLLTAPIILETASQKVAALRVITNSLCQWINEHKGYCFCYLELEKMRGKDLSTQELKELANHLASELGYHLQETAIFWPYNHEEAFKQLLILAKEVHSPQDLPQVSIHFQKQTSQYLDFLVYLARPQNSITTATAITDDLFPLSTEYTPHLKEEINIDFPKTIEAFSLLIPIGAYKKIYQLTFFMPANLFLN